jgi:hypothetical protein
LSQDERKNTDRCALNIGSGGVSKVTSLLETHCDDVRSLDMRADVAGVTQCDYMDYAVDRLYDVVWCSHVLEHQENPTGFLRKIFIDMKSPGWLAITVPPMKNEIVSGHLTLWNAGLLLYHLVIAGFDCRHAKVSTYDYNCSVIVQRQKANTDIKRNECGDVELADIEAYLPIDFDTSFNGQIEELNWRA